MKFRLNASLIALSLVATTVLVGVPAGAEPLLTNEGVITHIDLDRKSFDLGNATYLVESAWTLDQLSTGDTVVVQSEAFNGTSVRIAYFVELRNKENRATTN